MTDQMEIERSSDQNLGSVDRRNVLKQTGTGRAALGFASMVGLPVAVAQDMLNGANNFYKSDRVTMQRVSFKTKCQMSVVGGSWLSLASRTAQVLYITSLEQAGPSWILIRMPP